MQDLPEKPYKFLDSYKFKDRKIFFGRDREVGMLIDDVLVNRIVVLFAHSGTGKTSLINAGVRPRLEAQGYKTFFIRVSRDPVESARAVLSKQLKLNSLKGEGLGELIENVVTTLDDSSIVLFFDQFEEFFLYLYKNNRKKAMKFISDIASLYHNERRRVRTVFSMRENFFVEMDVFRDEIPSIFHKDSNLRLRGFDKEQAREAIINPARVFQTTIDPDLVERLLTDLAEEDDGTTPADAIEIEPAKLQIVCDSLWPKRIDNRITLQHYLDLGQDDDEPNISRRVLFKHLESQFSYLQREQLELLNRLLPQLRTREGTKYVRDLQSLAKALETPEATLRNLVDNLVQVQFVRLDQRDNLQVIELTHDYLVDRLDDLGKRVRAIWPRRKLDDAVRRFRETRELALPEELEAIATEVETTVKNEEQADLLFRSGLANENRIELWFDVACRKGIAVWEILRRMITEAEVGEAFHVLNLLDSLILRRERENRRSAQTALKAFSLLRLALERENLAPEAQGTLARLSQSQNPLVASTSRPRLLALLKKNIKHGRLNSLTLVALGSIDASQRGMRRQAELEESLKLLQLGLARDDLMPESEGVLLRFMKSNDSDLSARATQVLLEFAQECLDYQREAIALDVLMRVPTVESVRMIGKALGREDVKSDALEILQRFAKDDNPQVQAAAVEELSFITDPLLPPTKPKPTPTLSVIPAEPEIPRVSTPEISDATLAAIADDVKRGQSILFLGSGVHSPAPDSSRFEYSQSSAPSIGSQLSNYLAQISGYPERDTYNLQRVAAYFEISLGFRMTLIEEIKSAVQIDKTPSPLLAALARLPFSLIITTNYDNLFEQALVAAGKQVKVSIYEPDPRRPTADCPHQPTAENPFVLKLYGDLDRPESVVITDEDFLQFTLRMTDKHPYRPVPQNVMVHLAKWKCLFLGYNFRDYNSRLLFKALRWKMDVVSLPPVYAVDLYPDPLIRDLWEARSRYLRFIVSNLWDFVPKLYQQVSGQEMPSS